MKRIPFGLIGYLALVIGACAPPGTSTPPVYDHVVIVVEENRSADEVMGSPYLSELASRGTFFSQSYGITHPSQPNYIALFSGSTQYVADNLHHDLTAPNLATSLAEAGRTFTGYSEGLPSVGFRGDSAGAYVRRHNPWASFTNVPDEANRPFSDFPTADFAALPTVSIVVPDLNNDMHDGSVATGDAWLAANLDAYARWAPAHNSLLVVTFDEGTPALPAATTPIATIFVGAGVRPGLTSDQRIDHYSLLRMLEDMYSLPHLGEAAGADPIVGLWE
jgi:phospholipase C